MKLYGKYHELPIPSIHPQGWLRKYLENQRNGLTGFLDIIGFPFWGPGWAGKNAGSRRGLRHNWWPYEQVGYWVDGVARCGYLLNDAFLIQKARKQGDYVLHHAEKDGYLGPHWLKYGCVF